MNNIDKMRRGQDILKWIQDGDLRAMIDEVVEMTYEWRQYKDRQLTNLEALFPHPAVVDIANRTGANLSRFSVLQLGGPMIDPTLNLDGFKAAPSFAGVFPTNPPDLARFAVLLDALPAGNGQPPYPVGRGVIAGAVACQVNVTSTEHGFAVPIAGNVNILQSSASAVGAVLLSRATAIGLQWCQVSLGRCCAGNFGTIAGSGCVSPCAQNAALCVTTETSFLGGQGRLDYGGAAHGCIWSGLVPWPGVDGSAGGDYPTEFGLGLYLSSFHSFLMLDPTHWYVIVTSLELVYDFGPTWDCGSTLTGSFSGGTFTIAPGLCADGGGGGCCGNTDPSCIVVFSGALAFLGTVILGTVGTEVWSASVRDTAGCTNIAVGLQCQPGGASYSLSVRLNSTTVTYSLTTASCSPFHLTGTGLITAVSPCCAGGSFGVDVTSRSFLPP